MTEQPTSSLPDVHGSVTLPVQKSGWRRFFAFAGPAYLVSVGYMDPGNWATDLAAGSRYGYQLIWVLLMSNLMAIVLQSHAARLGLVSGRDLAQACRDRYPDWANFVLWILCEIAIAATDLAEIVGAAIGLQLLFGIPVFWGVLITTLDTFILLLLHQAGIRMMEAFILTLVATIGACLFGEILLSRPDVGAILNGFVPTLPDADALYFAIGIIGATVMPHNLYLHSSLVQTRKVDKTAQGINESLKYNFVDSVIALNLALFINAAILIMAAAVFHRTGHLGVAEIEQAHELLAPIVGSGLAPILFAVALICAGQSSTITGTLAGQIVMEGFLNLRLKPWIRRLVTRAVALVPAMITVWIFGDHALGQLLVLSQVILSLQLPFAIVPLLQMVSDRRRMGAYVLGWIGRLVGWVIATIIVILNGKLVIDSLNGFLAAGGMQGAVAKWVGWPVTVILSGMFIYILVEPWMGNGVPDATRSDPHGEAHIPVEILPAPPFRKVAAALDFGDTDNAVLALASAQAHHTGSPLLLFHVVESAGAVAMGGVIEDSESRLDLERLHLYALALGRQNIPVDFQLGFGEPADALAALIEANGVDLLVVGAHGHRGVSDWIHGSTIDDLRHRLKISVLVACRT